MDYGIKISKLGFNVDDLDDLQLPKGSKSSGEYDHRFMLLGIAVAYQNGAVVQLARYVEATKQLTDNPTGAVYECLHEASNLFEDLDALVVYMRKSNRDHPLHAVWQDARHHIRHDIREGLVGEKSSKRDERADRLNLNIKLHGSLAFEPGVIKVGGTDIRLEEIRSYLKWSHSTIAATIDEAKAKGFLR